MSIKLFGVIFIIISCSGFGFSAAYSYEKRVQIIRQLLHALAFMSCELQYRLLNLPDLCRITSLECNGSVKKILSGLAMELERQTEPDVSSSMRIVLQTEQLPTRGIRRLFLMLGHSLGRFDLSGQLSGLEEVKNACERELEPLESQKQNMILGYRTLGICTGAALAILLL